jgi:LacI family transcriptional regulator
MKTVIVNLALDMNYGREILAGIQKQARRHPGVEFRVWRMPQQDFWSDPVSLEADGMIVHVTTAERDKLLRAMDRPVVNVSGLLLRSALPRVMSDDAAVGRLAAEHLLELGFARFGFVGVDGHGYSIRREAGFRERLGLARFDCEVFTHGACRAPRESWEANAGLLEGWLRSLKPPVGIMVCNDVHARRVVGACCRLGLRVPEEVAVIGVDNDDMESGQSAVPLTSVMLGAERIGFEAAAMVMRLMNGKPPPAGPVQTLPLGIARRHSTDVLAIADQEVARALRFIRDKAVVEPVGVRDVAREVAMSRRLLELRFRKALGRSPYAEILRVRIVRASELLAQTDLSMSEIAEAAGFTDARLLCVSFHRKTGMTPTAYRDQFRLRDRPDGKRQARSHARSP